MSQSPHFPGPPMRNEIDFGAFTRAWAIAKDNIGVFMLGALVTMLPTLVVSGIFQVLTPRPDSSNPEAVLASLGAVYTMLGISTVVRSFAQGISSVALASFCLGAVRNGRADINDAVAGFKKFGPAMLAGLLHTVGTYLGILACCVGMFVVAALLMFIYCDIADGTTNPMEAAMASFERTKDKILPAIAFMFLYGIVASLGLLACFVGLLFTVPLAMTAMCLVYCDLTGTGGPGQQHWVSDGASPYPRGQGNIYQGEPPAPPAPPEP